MPKVASKKAPPKKTAQTSSKAAQAASHQGRAAPAEERRPAPARPTQAPAVHRPAPPPAAVQSLPEFMRRDADLGKENISKDDIEIPRLKLMQAASPELQDFDDLKAGFFFHPSAEFIFDGPFRAVPVFMDKRYILWRPRDAGGGILARADDGVHWSPSSGSFTVQLDKKDGGDTVTWVVKNTVQESGLNNWGTLNPADPNSPPAATEMYNYLLAFPDEPDLMPAVLSFQRSSIKIGRRFNTKLKTVRAPIFGTVWEFRATEDSNNRGQSFFNIDVRSAGLITDNAQYQQYRSMYESFSARGLAIKDIEGLQSEDDAAGETAGDEAQGEAAGSPRY